MDGVMHAILAVTWETLFRKSIHGSSSRNTASSVPPAGRAPPDSAVACAMSSSAWPNRLLSIDDAGSLIAFVDRESKNNSLD